jgi:hypothetical protein
VIAHAMPSGQVMFPVPVPLMLQVMGDAVVSHPPLHAAGHTNASSSRASMGSVPVTQ